MPREGTPDASRARRPVDARVAGTDPTGAGRCPWRIIAPRRGSVAEARSGCRKPSNPSHGPSRTTVPRASGKTHDAATESCTLLGTVSERPPLLASANGPAVADPSLAPDPGIPLAGVSRREARNSLAGTTRFRRTRRTLPGGKALQRRAPADHSASSVRK